MQPHRVTMLRLAASGIFFFALATQAGNDVAVDATSATEALPLVELKVPFKPVSELGRTVDAGRLADLRGGDGTTENLIDVDGSVEGNTANRIISGSNAISDGAFGNSNGINTVIQNTGTNVLIQNAMIVTVDFVDPMP
ncbi:hypothetical protein OVA13_04675 [Pseudoxanthomonas sp. SL93]|jgi:hypothetical protein|uniref:hypothetical protein n=1 Tax=Pseudoxanthomonas sp. SL93 TaxID=2995142 RepID=UPI002271F8C2|nr:hypothetical protein [Pseudoxanthomonas sp. SL93]WAC64081.1 hypothetical protein OVA13_04675 [Pseudoxanthomonas sp. SL93]